MGNERERRRVVKLTKRSVDAVRPESGRLVLWDADLAGFGLRVEPSGRKTFIARYRTGGGRAGTLRQITIGRYGPLTVEQGRALAKKALGAAAVGGDPLAERHAERHKGVSVGEICDWYISNAEESRILGRRGLPIKASTLATDRSRIESHVKPLIGKRSVDGLTLRDIEEMQADIAALKTAASAPRDVRRVGRGSLAKGGSGTAARTLGMLRTIFEHAARRQMISHNPARGARKIADRRRTVRLSLEQIELLGNGIRMIESESATGAASIRFTILSGFRRGEVLGLRRSWIIESGGVAFPDTKSGPQTRPLGMLALDLVRSWSELHPDSEWVFPGDRGQGHYVGLPRALTRACMYAGLSKVTPHTLRHTFASVAAELGYSELTIAGLLGHSAGSITSRYVHLDRALVTAADRVSEVIGSALDGTWRGRPQPIG